MSPWRASCANGRSPTSRDRAPRCRERCSARESAARCAPVIAPVIAIAEKNRRSARYARGATGRVPSSRATGERLDVLIVEDDVALGDVMAVHLGAEGWGLRRVETG